MASVIRFELLGPLRVCVGDEGESIPSSRTRVVLVMLLLHVGRTVSVEQLTEAVWSGAAPSSARNQIQTCVSQLRSQFAGELEIVTEPAGYRLDVDPQRVDARRFRTLVADARAAVAAGQTGEARQGYRAALGLWRGSALAGVDSELVRGTAEALDAEREQALEECLETELVLGGAGELVAELTELVHRFPYRERLHAALMRALYRAGHTAEALAAYRRARQLFHDELGTDPGEELQRLHQAILKREPDLAAPTPAPVAAGLRELPVEATCFVGRTEEINRVRGALMPAGAQARRRPPVVVLYGPGGTGKSALAVRVAHDLAEQFPDGQLYVDLCGSTPGMRPLPPPEVLGRFLRRLGVHPAEVPPDEAEATALFRSLTTDRRLLIVLDNAADKEQIAGLVPATPSCAVLVTSRHPLPTLDAGDRLRLGPLPEADGRTLLSGLTGRGQPVEVEAVGEVVALCGGLPLAIRIAAGRLAARPDLTITEYAQRLADRSHRLDELQLDDLAVRTSIRTSYDALLADPSPAGQLAARAFRMLGLLHVPDLAPPVLAAMLAEPDVETARAALDRLVDAQLLDPLSAGRYRLHDLVCLVATERAANEDTAPDREQAVDRAIAFYTSALWSANRRLRPSQILPFREPPVSDAVMPLAFFSESSAREWVDVEVRNLEAALSQAAIFGGAAIQLSRWLSLMLWESLNARCDWPAARRVSRLTVEIAQSGDDKELTALGFLLNGRSEACLGSYNKAVEYLELALNLMRQLGNQAGVALALNGLGVAYERHGEPAAAVSHFQEALECATVNRLASLAGSVMNNMIVGHVMRGQLDDAIAVGDKCATVSLAVQDYTLHATTELNLSVVYCLRGNQLKALEYVDRALSRSREAGDRLRMCEGLVTRSEANLRCGNLQGAYTDSERARILAEECGYSHVLGVAEGQRSRILAAWGKTPEVAVARARARDAFARVTSKFRDPMIELLIAEPSLVGSSVTGTTAEAALGGAFDENGDTA